MQRGTRCKISDELLVLTKETEGIFIPSVFVSRASFLLLRDLLANETSTGREQAGLWIEMSEGSDEGG